METLQIELSIIKETVMQVAEAITAALEIETEIVDHRLCIIGGTGRYTEKIGSFEEDGRLDTDYVYAGLLRSGNCYFNSNLSADPLYDAKEGELAEICCPIVAKGQVVGLIGLVAFTPEQKKKIEVKVDTYTEFLKRMAELLESKLLITYNSLILKNRLDSLWPSSTAPTTFKDILGHSTLIEEVKLRALQVATNDSTVLITGESGTGKEIFARAIHWAGLRRDKAFVSINCGAIPEMLLESELFGYEKGAFTGAVTTKMGKFELADKGTIFLDEIGDMPLHLQVKILRAIQQKIIERVGGIRPIAIDVRIIAATNQDLDEMVRQKQFREDLFFRLNVIPLHIPPLRSRKEDIEEILMHNLRKLSVRFQKPIGGISKEALDVMMNYSWPGNIRELENILEYAVNMETEENIQIENLPDKIRNRKLSTIRLGTLKSHTDEFQRQLIMNCLEETGFNLEGKQMAAENLGISESTLYRKIRELKI